ncbi:hypothetical protein FW755_03750 [Lonepinella koalarum]|uniref:hypothetical protein n=1 Tax=Lonepinella koalarum TaxID=53417 RepID=UPI0011E4602F|nr:hypothetical protein [Lonepinella koalarum]TYG34259.1 hypothetical protein FW755_03750 [Lonepinella koalarum]
MLKKLLLVTMIGLSFSISIYANEIDDLMVKAEQGDEQALFDLALKYYHGDGVKQAFDILPALKDGDSY